MEIFFNHQILADLYEGKKVVDKQFRSNPTLVKQYIKTINKLKAVQKVEQLFQFSGLNYEKLKGNMKGYSSVRIINNTGYYLKKWQMIRSHLKLFSLS